MAKPRMLKAPHFNPAARQAGVPAPIHMVRLVSVLLILVLCVACSVVLLRLREDALRTTEQHLNVITLTLAEQADRAVQGMDLVLDDIARLAISDGVKDRTTFEDMMSTEDVHRMLLERMIGFHRSTR